MLPEKAMSSNSSFSGRSNMRRRVPKRAILRTLVFGISWLPSLVFFLFYVPQFREMCDVLRDRGELPATTDWLLWLAQVNEKLFCLPLLLFVSVLFLADVVVFALCARSHNPQWFYLRWIAAMFLAGMSTLFLMTRDLLLLVVKL
jgi:type II secretory pathway component PulF